MTPIFYHDKAISDLREIWLHIAVGSGTDVAERCAWRIDDTIRRIIGIHPASGRRRPEFGPDVRSLPIVPYVAFYRIEAKRVTVLRVLHGRRDLRQPLMSLLTAVS